MSDFETAIKLLSVSLSDPTEGGKMQLKLFFFFNCTGAGVSDLIGPEGVDALFVRGVFSVRHTTVAATAWVFLT